MSPRSLIAAFAALVALLTATPAEAQMRLFGTGLGSDTLQGAAPYGNPIRDDRVYVHGYFDQLEGRLGEGSALRWDGQAWIGNDYHKLWLKSEGRYNAERRGKVSDGDHELLYARPISTFFDLQAGVRYDFDDSRGRTWAALGVQGLAIGFWNLQATAYSSDSGHYAFRTNASYDLYLTQRLVLQPQFETNWYSKLDRGRGVGAGLSDLDMGLRLRYDLYRKLAPYIGVTYQRFFGGTLNLRRDEGRDPDALRFVAGVRMWF